MRSSPSARGSRSGTVAGFGARQAVRRVGSLVGVLLALATPAGAQHYEFDLTRFDYVGTGAFTDEFSDGDRGVPPTSSFLDLFGTTTEKPGSLRLSSADGAEAFELAPFFAPGGATGYRDVALLSPGPQALGFFDGGGSALFRTTWSGPLPEVAGLDHDRHFFSYVLSSTANASLSLSVLASSYTGDLALATCQQDGPRIVMVYAEAFLIAFGCDPFDPEDVTGEIVLEIRFDDATDSASFAYSLDGGGSFRESSAWLSPPGPVVLPVQGGFAFVGVGAAATRRPSDLPGPGIAVAGVLLLSGWQAARSCGRRPRTASARARALNRAVPRAR